MAVPIETPYGPVPVPLPWAGHPPPIPKEANPLPALVDLTERKWETVAGWVSSTWKHGISFLEGAASLGLSDVETIVDTAINTAQTAWSSYVSILTDWITVGIDEVGSAVGDARIAARADAISLGRMIEALGADALGWVADGIVDAERYADRVIDALAATVLGELANVETWAIDSIAHPLLQEIERVRADVFDALERGLADVQSYARDLVTSETLERLAAVGAIVGALAALEAWKAECGDPICNLIGPGTALAGLLGNAELLELLAMLLALTSLEDPEQVARAAVYVTNVLAPAIENTIENWLEPLAAAPVG